MRDLVHCFAMEAGMTEHRAGLLVMAVNEIVTNVLEHAGGTGTLRACGDERGVTVHVTDDAGTLTTEHLQRVPGPVATRGMGLWLVRQVCDEVWLDHPGGRTHLRLSMFFEDPATSSADRLSDELR
ncbi:ATP-binding protein [Nonomuraea jiangxiensis]|nr:ATP-binding protein [Nonomuraea jiangxiensis]